MRNLILCVLFALCFAERPQESYGWRQRGPGAGKRKVAIVGGGIGGCTAAHFLRQALGDDVEISVYEKEKIGGRVATVKVGQRFYESGGAVLHRANHYMAALTESLGLKKAKDFPVETTWGLYDPLPRSSPGGSVNGNDIVFQTNRYRFKSDWWNNLQLFRRYGSDLKQQSWLDDLVNWYEKIYPAQDGRSARSFDTVYDMFHFLSSDFDGLMTSTLDDYLKRLGFKEKYRKEIARVATRINYGQDLNIQAFVGAISMAGMQGGLWSVEGGNFRVAEAALKASKALWKKKRVTELKEFTPGGRKRFLLTSIGNSKTKPVTEEFDAVVLALPCTKAGCGGIDFSVTQIKKEFAKFPASYHRTVANFIKGKLNPRYFKTADLPDSIWSVAEAFPRGALKFLSIDRQVPVDYGTKPDDPKKVSDLDVYKIFTQTPMTKSQVAKLFQSHSDFVIVDWKAYPKYDEVPKDAKASLPSFILDSDGGLISINAIEAAASCIEQSVVGAKNAALLVAKYLKKQ